MNGSSAGVNDTPPHELHHDFNDMNEETAKNRLLQAAELLGLDKAKIHELLASGCQTPPDSRAAQSHQKLQQGDETIRASNRPSLPPTPEDTEEAYIVEHA